MKPKQQPHSDFPTKWVVLNAILILILALLAAGYYHLYRKYETLNQQVNAAAAQQTAAQSATAETSTTAATSSTPAEIPEATAEASAETPSATEAPSTTETPSAEATLAPPSGESSEMSSSPSGDMQTLLEDAAGEYSADGSTWSFYIQNLSTGATAGTNSDARMQAASLIKLYIMGAVYQEYDSVCVSLGTDTTNSLLTSMITVSDNDAANTLVDALSGGLSAVNTFCSDNGYATTHMGRYLLQDNSQDDNYTSTADCGQFLSDLYNNAYSHSEEMINLLAKQERRNKIPAGIPSGVTVANKTGELEDVENDAAIVYASTPYVFCAMSENLSAAGDAQTYIASLSGSIYENYQ